MQAIETKYYGVTNTRGARIVARASAGKVSIPFPYDAHDPHLEAAKALCVKFNWQNELIGGGLHDGREVFVMIPRGFELVEKQNA